VAVPVRGKAPVTKAIDTAQYTGTISWSPADDYFKPQTVYTANIVLTAKTGYTLSGVAENFFTVAGATATNAAGSGNVTVVFAVTAAETDTEVAFISAAQTGGTSGTANSTGLTLTFSANPTTLTADNITVTGATKGALSVSGATRTLAISNITVANGKEVTVTITSPTGYSITEPTKKAVVYKASGTVKYDGNGATGGSVPEDGTEYAEGATVTVLGNTGALVKTGFTFIGWNTRADGSGATYSGGQTFVMGSADVTLYATWAASGSLDTSFDSGTGANNRIRSIVVQSDGKILIGGDFDSYNGTKRRGIARLNADGTLDTSFTGPGTDLSCSVESIVVQDDGKILIGGRSVSANGGPIARLNADGTFDTSFECTGIGLGGDVAVLSIAVNPIKIPQYQIIIGGTFDSHIAFLNNWGTVSRSCAPDNTVTSISASFSSASVYFGGYFSSCNGTPRNYIGRMSVFGTFEGDFNPEVDGGVESVVALDDSYVLIGGDFTNCNGKRRERIAILDSTGMPFFLFDPGSGANRKVICIVPQGKVAGLYSTGKILIGGAFTAYNGTARGRIARLNANGTLDTSFDPGTGANGWVYSIAVQADGKILIGGEFTAYNGTARGHIARIWN
jgi:uncharacterized delta-60 repeat protein/uncharacterized repeat protein (TIGR02543 family)